MFLLTGFRSQSDSEALGFSQLLILQDLSVPTYTEALGFSQLLILQDLSVPTYTEALGFSQLLILQDLSVPTYTEAPLVRKNQSAQFAFLTGKLRKIGGRFPS